MNPVPIPFKKIASNGPITIDFHDTNLLKKSNDFIYKNYFFLNI